MIKQKKKINKLMGMVKKTEVMMVEMMMVGVKIMAKEMAGINTNKIKITQIME